VTEATYSVIEAIEQQATSCALVGSDLYSSLLTGLAGDYLSGGLTSELLDGVSDRPFHDAVPLRYLATAHRLALAGEAPTLAAHYPSCGGAWDGSDITDWFLSVVALHRGEFVRGLQRNVQTNEVGRAVVLASGFSTIADRYGLPLRTFEIGASAGLLSRWNRYWYSTGESSTGDADSSLRFGPTWFDGPSPHLHTDIKIVDRAAVDISPIDAATEEGRLTMLSFVWPDQSARFESLRAALAIARDVPLDIDAADAGEWLTERLAADLPSDVATVVFHSIVWQYLARDTKDAVRAAVTEAGSRATTSSPVCWLRMEPATREHADLRLTEWPGGADRVLAHVGYHGANVRWLA
jgi:hypothetical protein